jgi:tetratricopeptide (TPR) repeat protein
MRTLGYGSVVLALLALLVLVPTEAETTFTPDEPPNLSDIQEGVSLFLADQPEEALPWLLRAVDSDPGDPEAAAWLAEALRRSGQIDEAIRTALDAIGLDSCNSLAWMSLGSSYLDQGMADTAWTCLLKAVQCDPAQGTAWLRLLPEAMRRDRIEDESKALKALVHTGFFTEGALASARWLLRYVPPRSVLLISGEMNFYTMRAVQEAENFRPDVAVIDLALLERPWYAPMMVNRYGLPSSFTTAATDVEEEQSDARAIVENWMELRRQQLLHSGRIERPLAVSLTAGSSWLSDNPDEFTFVGTYWAFYPKEGKRPVSDETMWYTLEELHPENYSGPFLSVRDVDPVRRIQAPGSAREHIVSLIRACSQELTRLGHGNEAFRIDNWTRRFEERIEIANNQP